MIEDFEKLTSDDLRKLSSAFSFGVEVDSGRYYLYSSNDSDIENLYSCGCLERNNHSHYKRLTKKGLDLHHLLRAFKNL
jgi:hypothetical protein